MLKNIKSLFKYLTCDIWYENLEAMNVKRLRKIRALRIGLLICNGFTKDRCSLHAASLTFISLLSFVPLLAVCFLFVNAMGTSEFLHEKTKAFVGKFAEAPLAFNEEVIVDIENPSNANIGNSNKQIFVVQPRKIGESEFGLGEEALNSSFSDSEEKTQNTTSVVGKMVNSSISSKTITIDTINRLIDVLFEKIIIRMNFNALGIVGFIFFFWAVFNLLGKIELAFNSVWKQKKQRSFFVKLRDYSVVFFVVPVLCLLAFLIPVFNLIINNISKYDGGFVATILDNGFTRFILIASLLVIAFAIIHKAIPNVKVQFRPALIGGVFTAIGFVLWFKLCLSFQIGVAKYNAVFGSFAMVPILLFWVYISWKIILLGAEIAYAVQNWRQQRLNVLENN